MLISKFVRNETLEHLCDGSLALNKAMSTGTVAQVGIACHSMQERFRVLKSMSHATNGVSKNWHPKKQSMRMGHRIRNRTVSGAHIYAQRRKTVVQEEKALGPRKPEMTLIPWPPS